MRPSKILSAARAGISVLHGLAEVAETAYFGNVKIEEVPVEHGKTPETILRDTFSYVFFGGPHADRIHVEVFDDVAHVWVKQHQPWFKLEWFDTLCDRLGTRDIEVTYMCGGPVSQAFYKDPDGFLSVEPIEKSDVYPGEFALFFQIWWPGNG